METSAAATEEEQVEENSPSTAFLSLYVQSLTSHELIEQLELPFIPAKNFGTLVGGRCGKEDRELTGCKDYEVAFSDPIDACPDRLVNEQAIEGKIIFTRRGNCTFLRKARVLNWAKAAAVVVINSDAERAHGDEIFSMEADNTEQAEAASESALKQMSQVQPVQHVGVPVVMISYNSGQKLAELQKHAFYHETPLHSSRRYKQEETRVTGRLAFSHCAQDTQERAATYASLPSDADKLTVLAAFLDLSFA